MISFYGEGKKKKQPVWINPWKHIKSAKHAASVPLSYNSSVLLSLRGLNLMADVALAPFEAEQPQSNPSYGTRQTVKLVSGAQLYNYMHWKGRSRKDLVTSINLSPFITSKWRPVGGFPALQAKG